MRLFNLTVASLVTIGLVQAASVDISDWSVKDVQEFLQDRNVEHEKLESFDELVKKVEGEIERIKNSRHGPLGQQAQQAQQQVLQKVKEAKDKVGEQLPSYEYIKYVFGGDDGSNGNKGKNGKSGSVSEWVFSSWSGSDLQQFLKKNQIKFDANLNKGELIKLAQEKYGDLAKSHESSGKYVGDWLFESWNVKSLKNWLEKNDIEVDKSASREELLKKVKEYSYLVSSSAADTHHSLLDSLNLAHEKVFDQAGKIRDDFFDKMSYDQIREWLEYYDVIEPAKKEAAKDYSIEELRSLIKSNHESFVSDVKSWVDSVGAKVSPHLEHDKGDVKDKLSEVINDTFLIGIDKWSKSRLQDFLQSRGVEYSRFDTKNKLIKLVKENKHKPLKLGKNIDTPAILQGWSTESLRKWLGEQGQKAEGSRKDLLKAAKELLLQESSSPTGFFSSRVSVYKPDIDDYKKSLQKAFEDAHKKAQGEGGKLKDKLKSQDKPLSEDAILSAYNAGLDYYNAATKQLSEKAAESSYSLDELLEEILKSSQDYALSIAENYDSGKKNAKDSLQSAQEAASAFVDSLQDNLSDKYKQTASISNNILKQVQDSVGGVIGLVTSKLNSHKSALDDASNEVYTSVLGYLSSANDVVTKAYNDKKQDSDKARKEAIKSAEEYIKQAQDTLSKKYEKSEPEVKKALKNLDAYSQALHSSAGKNFDKQKKALDDAYATATSSLQGFFDGLAANIKNAAQDAHNTAQGHMEKAQGHIERAKDSVKSTYRNWAPKVEKNAADSWLHILSVYSNADLKSYLQSFGYQYSWLENLNRQQLVKLANEQSSVFYGSSKSVWDKPIVDVLKDSTYSFGRTVGLIKEESFWDKLKHYLPFSL